jgi:hypothetical protein
MLVVVLLVSLDYDINGFFKKVVGFCYTKSNSKSP